jgi:hypothetical protein
MAISDAGRKDPSMTGQIKYERAELDFYPTPRSCVDAFLEVYDDDLPAFSLWEPFAGNGAISKVLEPVARQTVVTDIQAYEGLDLDDRIDFFQIGRDEDTSLVTFQSEDDAKLPLWRMADIEALKGFRPDTIITNPPYDRAEEAVRQALYLMEPEHGFVAMLLRHEWDCARKRADLFDHPAFAAKVVLRHRPRWIPGSTGAPRHNYCWLVWDFTKVNIAPGAPAELHYAG